MEVSNQLVSLSYADWMYPATTRLLGGQDIIGGRSVSLVSVYTLRMMRNNEDLYAEHCLDKSGHFLYVADC